jgi:hypothetical protein
MISVGRMAEKYGLLPHEVKERATTYDIMITDVLATYEDYMSQKSSGKNVDPSMYNLTEKEMKDMLETSRVKHN